MVLDMPARWRHDARGDQGDRAFTGAVLADDGMDLTGLQREGHAPDGHGCAVELVDVAQTEDGRHRGRPRTGLRPIINRRGASSHGSPRPSSLLGMVTIRSTWHAP